MKKSSIKAPFILIKKSQLKTCLFCVLSTWILVVILCLYNYRRHPNEDGNSRSHRSYLSTLQSSSSSSRHHDQNRDKCTTLSSMLNGRWNDKNAIWIPNNCDIDRILIPSTTTTDRRRDSSSSSSSSTSHQQRHHNHHPCLNNRRIGFYGDSTLRQIAQVILDTLSPPPQTTVAMGDDNNDSNNTTRILLTSHAGPPSYHNGGGALPGNGRIDMWWTPSVYYQQPASLGQLTTETDTIISIAAWDMSQYYRGVQPYFLRLKQLLREALEQKKQQKRRQRQRRLYILSLHKTFNNNCRLVHNTTKGRRNVKLCRLCNDEVMNEAFREALDAAVACVNDEEKETEEEKEDDDDDIVRMEVIDLFPVTNNSFAEARSDGLHFDETVTLMEAELVLQAICRDGRRTTTTGMMMEGGDYDAGDGRRTTTCPTVGYSFDEGRNLSCPVKNQVTDRWNARRWDLMGPDEREEDIREDLELTLLT